MTINNPLAVSELRGFVDKQFFFRFLGFPLAFLRSPPSLFLRSHLSCRDTCVRNDVLSEGVGG